jgi:hypothetical protein
MKSIKVFLFSLLLLPLSSQASGAIEKTDHSYVHLIQMEVVDGVSVNEVITACADYLQMTETYLHEHLVSFVSTGYNGEGEEYGTITFSMDSGNETYNWRVEDGGGSNVIVIWPT